MKIIAEIGSNCTSLEEALVSVNKAKRCGANIVKFQLIEPGDLYIHSTKKILDRKWIPKIADYCNENEIEFMCSAFSTEGYEFIDPFVKRHKIASCEVTDISILRYVNNLGKPVLLSTGCVTPEVLKISVLPYLDKVDVTIMFCVSEYPAQIIDFAHFEILRATCGTNYTYGFSDHSTDSLIIPRKAQFHGASIIEKHVNFIQGLKSDDSPHSLNERAFFLMCRHLRDEHIFAEETYCIETRDKYLRRPVAITTIKQGERLLLGKNIKYYRARDIGNKSIDITLVPMYASCTIQPGQVINNTNLKV